MKRLLTYGLLMLTMLAGLFVVSACQEDTPYDSTEVMMTFTTRTVVTQENEDTAIDVERMKDLRVIMVRENGEIVHNHKVEDIKTNSVTITFQTAVEEDGEDFKFFAIANEGGLIPNIDLANIKSSDIATLLTQQVGGSAFAIPDKQAIPQTKYWTYPIERVQSQSVSETLDYLVGKISVQFDNKSNSLQQLENIYITGITPNTQGYLFEQVAPDYITTSNFDGNISFEDVSVQSNTLSKIQHYYTYPIGFISQQMTTPTLHATWKGQPYSLDLTGISSLLRGEHLKIVVTLTGQELTVNYTIAPWMEHATNIGSPTPEGGYKTEDWEGGNDVVIGGEDEPEEPEGGDTPIDGSVLWSGEETLNWTNLPISCEAFNDLDYDVTTLHKIKISFNATTANDATLQFLCGDENTGMGIPELNNSNSTTISAGTTSFEFSISEAMLSNFIGKENSAVAFYVRGYQLTITEVLLYLPTTQ